MERIKKIEIESFIMALSTLYNMGLDYIDMWSEVDNEGNVTIHFHFEDSYVNPEYVSNFENKDNSEDFTLFV